jgi:ABC-2 type transport system permease protein
MGALGTLAARRFQLMVRTPRELFVPLLTPLLFALVIAPALKAALHTSTQYEAFVALGTVGLLVPLNSLFSGLSVMVDRESGAQRELLAAPVPRSALVVANLLVALAITSLQIATLIGAAALRGISLDVSASRIGWFLGASVLLALAMSGVAEALASRVERQEEYVARVPAIAIAPWFIAGALFPISALPGALEAISKVLPLTHALAVLRYGMLGDAHGLRELWGSGSVTGHLALSLAVLAAFATATITLAVRSFARSAVA